MSNNGVILAPIINIHGLVLRANGPIPVEIKDFLEGEGAKISRVRYKDELYVSITGCYRLDKSRVQEFIEQNWDLVDEEKFRLYTVLAATNLQSEISEYMHQASEGKKLEAKFDNQEYTAQVATAQSGRCIRASLSKILFNSGRFLAGRDINLSAREQTHLGLKCGKGKFGFFAECKANRNASFKGKINATNAIFDSGNKLKFEGDSLNITLETAVTWGNNPHPDLHRLGS